jgi:hypothetical protein
MVVLIFLYHVLGVEIKGIELGMYFSRTPALPQNIFNNSNHAVFLKQHFCCQVKTK